MKIVIFLMLDRTLSPQRKNSSFTLQTQGSEAQEEKCDVEQYESHFMNEKSEICFSTTQSIAKQSYQNYFPEVEGDPEHTGITRMLEVMPARKREGEDFSEGDRGHMPWREIFRVWLILRGKWCEKSHRRFPTWNFRPQCGNAFASSPFFPYKIRGKPNLDPKCDTRSFRLLSTNLRRTCGCSSAKFRAPRSAHLPLRIFSHDIHHTTLVASGPIPTPISIILQVLKQQRSVEEGIIQDMGQDIKGACIPSSRQRAAKIFLRR